LPACQGGGWLGRGSGGRFCRRCLAFTRGGGAGCGDQREFDAAVGFAAFLGAIVGDGAVLAIAAGGETLDRQAAALQGDQHGLGPGLAECAVAAGAALAVGMARDFHAQGRAVAQHIGQRVDDAAGRAVDFGRAGREGDLAFGQHRLDPGHAFRLGRHRGDGVQRLVIADVDGKGGALAQPVGQDLGHAGAGLLVAGHARYLDRVGAHGDLTAFQLCQRFKPRKDPQRPAVGQVRVQPRGGIDRIGAKVGAGKAVDGVAQQLVGQAPAQFGAARVGQHGGEFGRPRGHGLLPRLQGRLQRKDRRQRGLQFADHAVEGGLRHLGGGQHASHRHPRR
jgi:hypothetical protein